MSASAERDIALSAAPGVRRRSWARNAERFALVGAWVIVIVVFSFVKPDTFPTSSNFQTIFGSQAVIAVLTLALLPPLLAGDYDLSVASMQGLAAMLLA